MTITFPDRAFAVTCTWKAHLLLKRQSKNKTVIEGICNDITSTLDSSAGYREKQCHNRMINSVVTLFDRRKTLTAKCLKMYIAYITQTVFVCDVSVYKYTSPLLQPTPPHIRAVAGRFWGCERFLHEFPQTCPKSFSVFGQLFVRIFPLTQIMNTFLWDDLPKNGLHVILHTLGTNSARIRR